MGWPVYRSEGYEADDTLASLARLIEEQGDTAVIVTGDQDLWQCVTDAVSVYKPQPRGVYLEVTPKTIEILTGGFRADQIVDYKAIVGDASDGYPGCPGIGPKGALALLTEYGSVDQIYMNLDKIKGATQKKLIDNDSLVRLSRKLAQLDVSAPVEFYVSAGWVHMPYPESAAAFIRKHGMASLERRIGHESFPEETHDAFPL
jgi:DNA polymerase-1